jgi:signal transduction histidine kinase
MSLEHLIVRRWPERRPVVLAAAATGFVAVFTTAYVADDPGLAIGILYLLPIMLLALELGLAGGVAAALAATAVTLVGDALGHPDLAALGVLTRTVSFVAAGALAGRFSDRMRDAHAREQRLLDSSLALSDARSSETLAAAAAEAALRTPRALGAIVELQDEPTVSRGTIVGRRTHVPIMARGLRLGQITVVHDGGLGAEDQAAVELLALQVGLAADNQRLLTRERDAAALSARLRTARSELAQLLDAQEGERRQVAETLHEDLAQALAGVLLGLRMLRRDSSGEALDEVHGQVVGVLDDVRNLATALRPSSLEQLGLVSALEGLAHQSDGRLSLRVEGVPDSLPEPLPTGAYRLVQDALGAARPLSPVQLIVRATDLGLDLDLTLELDDETRLAAAHAWVAVLHGSLTVAPSKGMTRLRAHLPLPTSASDHDARATTDPTGKEALTTVFPGSDSIAS